MTPQPLQPQRILMIKAHSLGIGDLLRSSAAWRALHDHYPGVALHLLFLSRHSNYPTPSLIQSHPLLASSHFLTIRQGTPDQPGPYQSWRLIRDEVQTISRAIQTDWVIDFEPSGLRTAWVTRWAAHAQPSRSIFGSRWSTSLGIAQFPGRAWFYDRTAPRVARYRARWHLPLQMDYTARDFVVLNGIGIARENRPIELAVTPDGQA
jgi:hypothetical protein